MKVCDLDFQGLNYWVSVAELAPLQAFPLTPNVATHVVQRLPQPFMPCVYWATGGPIIDREGISLEFDATPNSLTPWCARSRDRSVVMCARDPLVAAMRCHVASMLGPELPDEVPT